MSTTSERKRVTKALRARRDDIERRYGLRLVGLVGSMARGEERPDSDIDIVVDVTGSPSYIDVAEAEQMLADELGRPVDLVIRRALQPERRVFMERDLVAL